MDEEIDEEIGEEHCYNEQVEKPTFAIEPVKAMEPSGYGDVPLNVALIEEGDGDDQETGSGLVVAMRQRWGWHRRTRSAEVEIKTPTQESTASSTAATVADSTLPKPSITQRNHTIATETPSASISGHSIHVGFLTKKRDVEMGYISSASGSTSDSEGEDFREKYEYIPPPSPPTSAVTQHKVPKEDGEDENEKDNKSNAQDCSPSPKEDDDVDDDDTKTNER